MHTKQRFWFFLAILFVMLSIALGGWVWSNILSSQKTVKQPTTANHPVATATATPDLSNGVNVASGGRLIIPAIKVNAPIETVGKTSAGYLDVPTRNQWTGVGWYKEGPLPGQKGTAVIDGHLDRPGWLPAVFWDLKKLRVGDTVIVQAKNGDTAQFKVIKVANYKPAQAPIKLIFGRQDGTFLNLITCAGVWVPEENQTSERLVVYTQRVA
ncbi:class F sortase [Dictyobacter formicarum]|uniref:Class F sortase n=1 Tax=Dictyobacter formicarum TaxID=2778368 RepID=A0ABQ3VHF2_9CHLR|nr:class F sortase [Dictyobacter formicarum]GHO85617.1 class F sortase [Dictyobacter formicarum]